MTPPPLGFGRVKTSLETRARRYAASFARGPENRLASLELVFDVSAFVAAVEYGQGLSTPLAPVPNALYDPRFEDDVEALVVTTAARPHVIANVNRAWLELCRFDNKHEVLGQTLKCIQGDLTDAPTVEKMLAHVSAGRAADATLVNYKKSGEAFLNYLRLFPLYADLDPNSRPSHYVGILEDHLRPSLGDRDLAFDAAVLRGL